MRCVVATLVFVAVLLTIGQFAQAQVVTVYSPVVNYGYAASVPVTTYYAPAAAYYGSAPVTTYYAPAATPVTTYYAPAAVPVTSYYAPAAVPYTAYYAAAPAVVYGRPVYVRPKLYVPGQPIRNIFR